jgi:ADP-ribose pyrophosphatase YjhB (NUDIX family)
MIKRVAKVILYNKENQVLLQLRDNNPKMAYPNVWTLFGGRIEQDETAEVAVKRELKEEIQGLKINNLRKLFTKGRDQDGTQVEDNIFCAEVESDITSLKLLDEGQDMKYFSETELDKHNVFLPFKKYILEFLKNNKRA